MLHHIKLRQQFTLSILPVINKLWPLSSYDRKIEVDEKIKEKENEFHCNKKKGEKVDNLVNFTSWDQIYQLSCIQSDGCISKLWTSTWYHIGLKLNKWKENLCIWTRAGQSYGVASH